ncbi:hypothetical protein DSO57_1012740 [Entomophthora muscae]|uniref:Uncharacterized protein n=2 Tax=Entomophthora muscae TaxID=34485 RepID=A0ACC2U3N3_9FUNG|nr:hypothetical protein DSO57_1012740 [Entomophthora muscae]
MEVMSDAKTLFFFTPHGALRAVAAFRLALYTTIAIVGLSFYRNDAFTAISLYFAIVSACAVSDSFQAYPKYACLSIGVFFSELFVMFIGAIFSLVAFLDERSYDWVYSKDLFCFWAIPYLAVAVITSVIPFFGSLAIFVVTNISTLEENSHVTSSVAPEEKA